MKTQNREARNYVDVEKLEILRKENRYTVAHINSDVLGYKNKDVYRKKCNGVLSFNVEDLVLLSHLYDVLIDELITLKEN